LRGNGCVARWTGISPPAATSATTAAASAKGETSRRWARLSPDPAATT